MLGAAGASKLVQLRTSCHFGQIKIRTVHTHWIHYSEFHQAQHGGSAALLQGRGEGMLGTADVQFLLNACEHRIPFRCSECHGVGRDERGGGRKKAWRSISWWQQVSRQAVTRTCSRHKNKNVQNEKNHCALLMGDA
jgi:hypothetical protein